MPLILILAYIIIWPYLIQYVPQKPAYFINILSAAAIKIFAAFLFFKAIRKKTNSQFAVSKYETLNSLSEFAPLTAINDVSISKDKDFWALYKNQISLVKLPAPQFWRFINKSDIILTSVFIILFSLLVISPKSDITTLFPYYNNQAQEQNFEVIATNSIFLGDEKIILNPKKTNKLPKNSEVLIRFFGNGKNSKTKFKSEELKPSNNPKEGNIVKFNIGQSGVLEVFENNNKTKFKIKISKDKKPKIIGRIISSFANNMLLLEFNIKDDFAIDEGYLIIEGVAQNGGINHKIIEKLPLDKEQIKSGSKSNILFNISKSALIGSRVKAHLVIVDNGANITKSHRFDFNVPNTQYDSDIAQAINEIRLSIIRETRPFSPYTKQIISFYDENLGQELKFHNNEIIENAPKPIFNAYKTLKTYAENADIIGLDPLEYLGIVHAIACLEQAKSTQEARLCGGILWEIVDRLANIEKDPRAKIGEIIEKLKSAMRNNASPSDIEELKQDLKNAIKEHIQNLQEQSHETGDMEIEDKSAINGQDLSKMLENINENNSSDNIQKLDELNQLLQNLQLGDNAQGGNSGETTSNALEELQNSFDETQSLNPSNSDELAKKQEEISRKLEALNKNNDENLNEAIKNLNDAAKALRNLDKEGAQEAQKSAIEAILRSLNKNSDQNKDPLGRELPQNPTKQNGAQEEKYKIPTINEEKKTREIIENLRKKLNDGTISDTEKQYYENLLKEN